MRAKTDRAAVKMGQSKLPVVVDCKHILEADFTAAKVKEKINQYSNINIIKSYIKLYYLYCINIMI